MRQSYHVNFIVPYFGQFPNYFQLFLNSCACNINFKWTILTDNQKEYDYPANVNVIQMSFSKLVDKIQSKFEFKVCIDTPHKLCEYKPAYGYIFPEYIEGFRFWGYCDIDVIYGKLENFITEEVLSFDKIFTLGHMTIIRNKQYFNELFMQPVKGNLLYQKAFSFPDNFNFDEEYAGKNNINTIFEEKGIAIWKNAVIADIYTKSSNFRSIENGVIEKKMNHFFVWDHGRLIRYFKADSDIHKKEYMYIHLQKRRMNIQIKNMAEYKIIPNSFEDIEYPIKDIETCFRKIRKKHFNLHYFRIRWSNLKAKCKFIFLGDKNGQDISDSSSV